jgi:hypothetical protein
MTQLAASEEKVAAISHLDSSYADWGAISGGALVAAVIFITLTVFGSAVGLSLTSAQPAQGVSAKLAAIAISLWAVWASASSFAAGGYIAGRLRHRIGDATEHEVLIRDGIHGLIAWALAAIISGVILASSVGAATTAATKEAAKTASDYQLTSLFRGETGPVDQAVRQDGESVLKTITARKGLDQQDETLLAQLVSARTSISLDDAKARIATTEQMIRRSLDQARIAAVLAAFLTAAALAIGAAAAWGAAVAGGKQRDEGSLLSPMTNWS